MQISPEHKIQKVQDLISLLGMGFDGDINALVNSEKANKDFEFFLQELERVGRAFYVASERQKILLDESVFSTKSTETFGKIILVTGPSGVGKDTLVDRFLLNHSKENVKMVMATSRKARPNEIEGVTITI